MSQLLIVDQSRRAASLARGFWRETRTSLLVIGLFFGVLGGWAAVAPLSSAVVAQGFVVVSGARQAVQHREGGVVTRILVEEGQRVQAGEVLIELDATEMLAQQNVLTAQFINLAAQRSRLDAESLRLDEVSEPAAFASLGEAERLVAEEALAAQRERFDARKLSLESEIEVLDRRMDQLRAQISGSEAQVSSHERQIELLKEELEGVRFLNDRGLTPTSRVRELERALAQLEGGQAEYASRIASLREEIGETELEALRLHRERQEQNAAELQEVEQRLSELEPVREALQTRIERARLRSPASGRIVGLRIHTESGVIGPGQVVMEIVPEDRQLVVQAHIHPADVDALQAGVSAQVRLTAFPASQAPILFGSLSLVSADRMIDEATGAPYFLAEVAIDPEDLERIDAIRNGSAEMRAGMPADVVIPVRERTALQYLVGPLADRFWRAFRET